MALKGHLLLQEGASSALEPHLVILRSGFRGENCFLEQKDVLQRATHPFLELLGDVGLFRVAQGGGRQHLLGECTSEGVPLGMTPSPSQLPLLFISNERM